MDDMLETMYAAPGIGLAAVQIGVLKRVIVIDLSKADEKKDPLFIINPEIINKSNELMHLTKKVVYQYLINLQKLKDQFHVN